MKKTICYPEVARRPQSFKKSRVYVIPNQSMTLQEIIRRFVKREPLPQQKEGIYNEGEYDLEKVAKADMVEQDIILEEVKKDVEVKRKRAKKVQEDIERAMQKDPKEDLPAKPPVV